MACLEELPGASQNNWAAFLKNIHRQKWEKYTGRTEFMLKTLFPLQRTGPYILKERPDALFYTHVAYIHTSRRQRMAAFINVHCTILRKHADKHEFCKYIQTDKHTHTHMDGTSLWPDRNYDSCVIISSSPPPNKLPFPLALF